MDQKKDSLSPQEKKRKTLYLPQNTIHTIQTLAEKRGISFSQMVSDMIEQSLPEKE